VSCRAHHLGASVALGLALSACGGDDGSGPPPPAPTATATDTATPWQTDGCELSWEHDVEGFFANWCAPCHSAAVPEGWRQGAPVGLDLDTLDSVRAWASGVQSSALSDDPTMPPAGGPSADELDLVERWMACGMPGEEVVEPDPCDAAVRVPPTTGELEAACDGTGRIDLDGDVVIDEPVTLDCLCEITGDVVATASLTSSGLRAIGGRLEVSGAATELDTPELRTVGGDLEIHDLTASELVIDGLEDVGGPLSVHDTGALASLSMPRLRTLGGPLTVADGELLAELHWPRLADVVGDLQLVRLPALTSAESLVSVRVLPGELLLEETGVVELGDMRGFEVIEGGIRLQSNADLLGIDGFWHLEEVPTVRVIDAPELRGITGFDLLTHVDQLELREVPQLRDLSLVAMETMGALGEPDQGLLIADAAALEGVELPELRVVAGLYVARTGLVSTEGLASVNTVGPITFLDNDALATLSQPARSVQVGGLVLEGNDALASVTAFEGTEHLLGPVVVRDAPVLTELTLPSLQDVAGDLTFDAAPLLTDLSSLGTLSSVDGALQLTALDALSDVTALHGLDEVGGDLVVRDNPSLAAADAQALVDAIGSVGGTVDVGDNGP